MEETKAIQKIQKKEKSEALTMQPSYKNFVDYGRLLIGRIERNQLELARLCYRANQELGGQGKRNDLVSADLSTVDKLRVYILFGVSVLISASQKVMDIRSFLFTTPKKTVFIQKRR